MLVFGLSEEKPKWISILEKQIQDVEERLQRVEKTLKEVINLMPKREEALSDLSLKLSKTLVDSLGKLYAEFYNFRESFALYLLTRDMTSADRDALFQEAEEVKTLARKRGISVSDMVDELERKGTLPSKMAEFRKLLKKLREAF